MALGGFLHAGHGGVQAAIIVAKALFVLATAMLLRSELKRADGVTDAPRLYAALPWLLLAMVMLSPVAWEHHGIFLCLPFLVILPRLTTARDLSLFLMAYALAFWVPTFDFFPFSYGRLVAPLLLMWLAWQNNARLHILKSNG
jgi:hypothetical protein